jgi:UDP-N-acetylmuramate dehydrogenase
VSEALARAGAIIRETCGPRLREGFAMAPLTTFRIGGPAALFLEPEDDADLVAAGRALAETGIPIVTLGKGSNVLVPDEGFPGLVVRLGRSYRWAARDGDRLTAGGAMPLPALAGVALRHALRGLEFGVSIPATLGGAVRMNAGAHGREMVDVVETIDLFDLRSSRRTTIAVDDAGLTYRHSSLPPDAVVVGATVVLEPGDQRAIRRTMEEARDHRRRTQPLAEPNCGSVFANPRGDHAARLIDAAGLKGTRVGGVRVSEKHANFIVASPGASANDVVTLIELVRARVREDTGVELVPEVRLLRPVSDD